MQNRIKTIRNHFNLTQAQFAERLGLSRNYVAMMEIGQRVPSDRTINDICREFGVNRTWLEFGSGEPFSPISKNELLTDILGSAVRGNDSARDRLIRAFALLPEELFDTAERILIEISENLKNEK